MDNLDPLPARPTQSNHAGKLVLLRHGVTEWSKTGWRTGLTDIPLSAHGKDLARTASALVTGSDFQLILSSTVRRARRRGWMPARSPC